MCEKEELDMRIKKVKGWWVFFILEGSSPRRPGIREYIHECTRTPIFAQFGNECTHKCRDGFYVLL